MLAMGAIAVPHSQVSSQHPLQCKLRRIVMRFCPEPGRSLSAKELYLFDTVGFVRIPGFLSKEAAEECRSAVLACFAGYVGERRQRAI